jgi:hypothetical protein
MLAENATSQGQVSDFSDAILLSLSIRFIRCISIVAFRQLFLAEATNELGLHE